uniref:Homeobox-containing protein n=1 Tax=Strongyloides stercoralis TaxID=6248 RepID=A0A0K0ED76_STRER
MQNIILNKYNIYAERKISKKKLERLMLLKRCHRRRKTLLHLTLKNYKPMETLYEENDLEENDYSSSNTTETKKNYYANKIMPKINENIKIMENDENNLKKHPTIKPLFFKLNINSYKIRSVIGSIFFLSSCRGTPSIRVYH